MKDRDKDALVVGEVGLWLELFDEGYFEGDLQVGMSKESYFHEGFDILVSNLLFHFE